VYGGIRANWKLLMENFMEYYHLEPVHPQLCAVSGVDEHVRMQVQCIPLASHRPAPPIEQPGWGRGRVAGAMEGLL
jgi:phenylpropionate dioxygenase-like ring-hydroxylating dioxygenase large terminal subunit